MHVHRASISSVAPYDLRRFCRAFERAVVQCVVLDVHEHVPCFRRLALSFFREHGYVRAALHPSFCVPRRLSVSDEYDSARAVNLRECERFMRESVVQVSEFVAP